MLAQKDTRKRIWVTEIGWNTQGPDSVGEITQAENLCEARTTFERLPWVERVYWYCLRDSSWMPNHPVESYGLFHMDGTPKPAAYLFR